MVSSRYLPLPSRNKVRQPCQDACSEPARSRSPTSSRKSSELPTHTRSSLPCNRGRTVVSLPNTDWRVLGSAARNSELGPHIRSAGPGPWGCSRNPSPAELADPAAPPALPPPPWRVLDHPQLSQTQTGHPLPHPSGSGRNPNLASSGPAPQGPELHGAWGPGGLKKRKWGLWGVREGQAGPRKGPTPAPWAQSLPPGLPGAHAATAQNPRCLGSWAGPALGPLHGLGHEQVVIG